MLFGSILDLGNINSNICVRSGSLLKTDQEILPIELVKRNLYTINGSKIISLTETVYTEVSLILIKKNALGKNKPNIDTFITKTHKLLINNRLINPYKLINGINIIEIYTKSELLYNILLESGRIMVINNIEMETLDPNNKIAKLYLNN